LVSTELSVSVRKVLCLLTEVNKPLSAYEILARLSRSGLRSPPTVYRALDQLARRGLVHRLESINAFVACQHPGVCRRNGSSVSAFALCTSCGSVLEINASDLLKMAVKSGSHFFARVDKTVVELSGICRACSKKKRKG